MKQAIILFIIATLFSFLLALDCAPNTKVICLKTNIRTCKCVSKNYGNDNDFALSQLCNFPKHSHCDGSFNSVYCSCI